MKKVIVFLLITFVAITIWMIYSLKISEQTNKNAVPPYSAVDFQSTSEPSYIRDRIIDLVESSDYAEKDVDEKTYRVLSLIRGLTKKESSIYNYSLIEENTISVEKNRIWAIYTHPSDFYSMWVIEEGRVVQYSYSNFESWNNKTEIDTVYYIYR